MSFLEDDDEPPEAVALGKETLLLSYLICKILFALRSLAAFADLHVAEAPAAVSSAQTVGPGTFKSVPVTLITGESRTAVHAEMSCRCWLSQCQLCRLPWGWQDNLSAPHPQCQPQAENCSDCQRVRGHFRH